MVTKERFGATGSESNSARWVLKSKERGEEGEITLSKSSFRQVVLPLGTLSPPWPAHAKWNRSKL